MAPVDSQEDEVAAAKIQEILRMLEPFPAKISELLQDAGPGAATGHHYRRVAAIVQMELNDALESLKLMPVPLLQDHAAVEDIMIRLNSLFEASKFILYKADPRRRPLMQRFLQFSPVRRLQRAIGFHNHNQDVLELWTPFLRFGIHPYRWIHLVPASSNIELPPQMLKEGGSPPVGIDRPLKKIMSWLLPKDGDLSTRSMSIVGPCGIGKTTLAMEVSKRLACQNSALYYFHCCVIAQASRRNNRNELLLQDILSKVSDQADQSPVATFEQLIFRISGCLQEKRYFIIIDDMWDASDWGLIRDAFPNNNYSSRISITTRVKSVAWSCCTDRGVHVHDMKPLQSLDSRSLLFTRAFGSASHCPPDSMLSVCDEILRRSEGIPLLITRMADWLRGEEKELDAKLPSQLEHELSPSFSDLPVELKLLTLYMTMFPPEYLFDKDRLIRKWIYEGMIHATLLSAAPNGNSESCFTQLVDRYIITYMEEKHRTHGAEVEASGWHVNPFFMQFIASRSAEKGFVYTSTTLKIAAAPTTGCGSSTSIVTPRRLALHDADPLLASLLEKIDLSQTYSLAVSGEVEPIPLKLFTNLAVLDMEGWVNMDDNCLAQLCKSKMFFLGYLSIRNTRVRILPQDIKNLSNLRMLDISFTKISDLPLEVFKLAFLQELDLRGTLIRQFPNLARVQERFCTFYMDRGTTMPLIARHQQSSLRTAATIDFSEQPVEVGKALADHPELQVLAIILSSYQCSNKVYCHVLLSCIQKFRKLRSLTIHCSMGCSMEFLGLLSDPPLLLERSRVTTGRFATVPQWISGLERLSFIQITVCRLELGDLNILGSLPKLQCLIIGLDFIPTSAIVVENMAFPELIRLSVDCPVPRLAFMEGAMRKLAYFELKLCACPVSQNSTPSGISNLQSLMEVSLYYSPWEILSPNISMAVGELRKAVSDHPNQISVLINGFQDWEVQAANEDKGIVDAESVVLPTVGENSVRKTVETVNKTETEGEIRIAA